MPLKKEILNVYCIMQSNIMLLGGIGFQLNKTALLLQADLFIATPGRLS